MILRRLAFLLLHFNLLAVGILPSTFGQGPSLGATVDLLAADWAGRWTLSPQNRWDLRVSPTTGQTNPALYAANPVHADSFATVAVSGLTNSWRLSARFEILRSFPESNWAFARLAFFEGGALTVLADITWSPRSGTSAISMGRWDGQNWNHLYADPAGFSGLPLSAPTSAWIDVALDRTTRRLRLTFSPDEGARREVESVPLPGTVGTQIGAVGFSAIDEELFVHDFLLTRDFTGAQPAIPQLFVRRFSDGRSVLFWRPDPGFRYQLDGSRDLANWSEGGYFIGGTFAPVQEIEIPREGLGHRFFRMSVR